MPQDQLAVLKVTTALSNKPLFIKIPDTATSMDRIMGDAVIAMKNQGQTLEAQSLEQLYKDHQMFNDGKQVAKGDMFKDLTTKLQQVGNQTVQLAEISLVTSHSGGAEGPLIPNGNEYIILSDLQNNIYNLLKEKQLERDELVKRLAKPRTTIYDNLEHLILYGLVRKVIWKNDKRGRPKTFFRVVA